MTSSDTGQNKMEWAEPCALLPLLSTKLKIINSLVSSFPSPEKKKVINAEKGKQSDPWKSRVLREGNLCQQR